MSKLHDAVRRGIVRHWLACVSAATLLIAAGAMTYDYQSRTGASRGGFAPAGAALVAQGARLFAERCAACHGRAGTGSAMGPPLVHDVYRPSHHPDAAFYGAVRDGVRAHHWSFGNMPPIAGLGDEAVGAIVAYVRDAQRRAGIE